MSHHEILRHGDRELEIVPRRGGLVLFGQVIVALLLLAGCLTVFVPFDPGLPTIDGDSGWMYAINVAVQKGFVFGKDIVFTAGPYASTYTRQYYPDTDWQMLWSTGLLGLATAIGLIMGARDRLKISALPIVAFLGLNVNDQLIYCVPLLVLTAVYRVTLPGTNPAGIPLTVPVRLALLIQVIALALLPITKATFGVASLIVVTCGVGILVVRREWAFAMVAMLSFVVSLAAFWVIVGQPLTELPTFFIAEAPIVTGYNDAMSLNGTHRELYIFMIAFLALGLCYFNYFRFGDIPTKILAAGITILLLLAFRSGFVRHDGHALIAGGVIGLAGLVLALELPGVRPLLGLAVSLTAWGMIDRHYNDLNFATFWSRVAYPYSASAQGLLSRLADKNALHVRYDESLASIRQQQRLPPLEGSADIYSYGQSVLLAGGLEWAPRFVLQSYSAYTSSLLERDASV